MYRALPLVALTAVLPARAQNEPMVDLSMSDNGQGQYELRLRTDAYFDGLASGLTFTVRWPASAGVALDTAIRCYPFQDVVPVNAVAPVVDGQYMYRTFNGFGMSALYEMGLAWEPGVEYAICTADILVPGTTVELVNDAFTAANNRDFFCSLNGLDRTGIYFQSPEPIVNIESSDMGTGALDIMLIPVGDDFFGWVTDVNFTVRWPAASGVQLGVVQQSEDVSEYLTIEKVGGEVTAGQYRYQVFHGVGTKSISNSSDAWWAGESQLVMTVPIIGSTAEIMVVNDAWTAANDGSYWIELNGDPQTGSVEGLSTALSEMAPSGFTMDALITQTGLRITTHTPAGNEPLHLSLHAVTGQEIWSNTITTPGRSHSVSVQDSDRAEGLFILSARCGDQVITRRIVM